ncbi:hypothetical protein GA0111570_11273 [Raineyella antarctica]|uniref:Glycoprotein n=2 Tax=Raineyella antarctica TaxID=1577474 RepID=A0A1G6HS87_9ACTN|nr:hypothetical protein GA0111570_11273 [Raineyella antarctica]
MLAALLLALAYVAGGPVRPAQAADPVRVDLTSLSPRIATPGQTITLSGRATNTGSTTLTALQAYFWRDQRLLTTRDELDPTAAPVGARYLPTFAILGTNGTLAPGESADFTVTMPTSALGVPARDGVTMVGAQVRGSDGSGNTTLGRVRTWLPQDVGSTRKPIDVTTVVALTSPPSRVGPDRFVDDHLAGELASGGRLDALLDTAAETGRTWIVDPALVVAVADMADDGYTLTDGTAGTGQADARAWLQKFQALRTEGYRLPYGTTDIDLVGSIARPDVLRQAADPSALPGEVARLPLAVWPAGGLLTAHGLSALAGLDGPVTVLASNLREDASSAGGRTVVPYDPGALAIGTEMARSATQLRQASAATTFLDAVQGRTAQVRLVTDAAAASVDDNDPTSRTPLSSVPATAGRPVTVDGLLLPEPDSTPAPATPAPSAPVGQGGDVVAAATDRAGLGSMFADPGLAADMTSRVVSSLASSQWPGHADGYRAFRKWERDQTAAILRGNALTISAQPVLLTARQDIRFPVTVTNNLDEPVSVRLEFTSENNDRLHVPAVDVPEIGAGEAIGINAVPEVQANGRYTVQAQLTTPSGSPVGKPVDIDVQATQAGRVGWILMIVSGIVVIGTTVLRIKQVRTERSRG